MEILEELDEQDLVKLKAFGRIKIYTINYQNEAGFRLANFLKNWYRDANQNSQNLR